MNEIDDSLPEPSTPTLWQENHGTFLLFWMIAITCIGFLVLFMRPAEQSSTSPMVAMVDVAIADEDGPTLIVQVTGKTDLPPGEFKLAIYDSADTFRNPAEAVLKDSLTHDNGIAVWLIPIERLPSKFGIAAYHDADGNGELTKNQLGMPIEPFGFSRNARGLFGSPPAFEETLLERQNETWQIELLLR